MKFLKIVSEIFRMRISMQQVSLAPVRQLRSGRRKLHRICRTMRVPRLLKQRVAYQYPYCSEHQGVDNTLDADIESWLEDQTFHLNLSSLTVFFRFSAAIMADFKMNDLMTSLVTSDPL